MIQTIEARNITFSELETNFNLQLVEDQQIFREWQDNLPEITDSEKQHLDRVKASYSNLEKYPPILENTVKMVVLSPLLNLAGFYLPPFHIKSEKSIEISDKYEGIIVRGKLDILTIFNQFWVLAIESKAATFSLEVGKHQILAYMLANPNPEKPIYGMITNGSSFIFIKLIQQETPQYALSRLFYIFNPGNDLYEILRVLKCLGRLAINN